MTCFLEPKKLSGPPKSPAGSLFNLYRKRQIQICFTDDLTPMLQISNLADALTLF